MYRDPSLTLRMTCVRREAVGAAILYNSPLNQPALWAEPIGQCVST